MPVPARNPKEMVQKRGLFRKLEASADMQKKEN